MAHIRLIEPDQASGHAAEIHVMFSYQLLSGENFGIQIIILCLVSCSCIPLIYFHMYLIKNKYVLYFEMWFSNIFHL